jgi:hypothetical protein
VRELPLTDLADGKGGSQSAMLCIDQGIGAEQSMKFNSQQKERKKDKNA